MKHLTFSAIDPLGGGLLEEIAAEQADNDGAIALDDDLNGSQLSNFWSGVEEDLEKDPTWNTFAED